MNNKNKLTEEEKQYTEYQQKYWNFIIKCRQIVDEDDKYSHLFSIILMLDLSDYYIKNGITREDADELCEKYKYECEGGITTHDDVPVDMLGHTSGSVAERVIERKTGKVIWEGNFFVD